MWYNIVIVIIIIISLFFIDFSLILQNAYTTPWDMYIEKTMLNKSYFERLLDTLYHI